MGFNSALKGLSRTDLLKSVEKLVSWLQIAASFNGVLPFCKI
jgi:hypothetical protein